MKNTIGALAARHWGPARVNETQWSNYQTWRVWEDVITDLDADELRDGTEDFSVEEMSTALMFHVEERLWPDGKKKHSSVVDSWAAAFLIPVEWDELSAIVLTAVHGETTQ